jgi:hypothetical protein
MLPLCVAAATFLAVLNLTNVSSTAAFALACGGALLSALCGLAAIKQCSLSAAVAPALREGLRMWSFWGSVWVCKLLFALLPNGGTRTVASASRALLQTTSCASLLEVRRATLLRASSMPPSPALAPD